MATQQYALSEEDVNAVFSEQLADPNSWLSLNNMGVTDFFDFDTNVFMPHIGVGAGLKLVMNENFVISAEWATTFNSQDNFTNANFYLVLGYMF